MEMLVSCRSKPVSGLINYPKKEGQSVGFTSSFWLTQIWVLITASQGPQSWNFFIGFSGNIVYSTIKTQFSEVGTTREMPIEALILMVIRRCLGIHKKTIFQPVINDFFKPMIFFFPLNRH